MRLIVAGDVVEVGNGQPLDAIGGGWATWYAPAKPRQTEAAEG